MKSYGRDSHVIISAKFLKKSFGFFLIFIICNKVTVMDAIYFYLILEVSDVCKVYSKIYFVRVFHHVLLKA